MQVVLYPRNECIVLLYCFESCRRRRRWKTVKSSLNQRQSSGSRGLVEDCVIDVGLLGLDPFRQ